MEEFEGDFDEAGRLILPAEIMKQYGFGPGGRIRIEPRSNSLRLRRAVTHLAKVYIEPTNRCPFIEKGALAIRWDGEVSPCLALLHNHKTYLYRYERSLKRHTVGNVLEQSLKEIWNKAEYLAFRRRLQEFSFSPCTQCGGCDYFETNEEDCIGSPFPACGGCLWAQGIIQCP